MLISVEAASRRDRERLSGKVEATLRYRLARFAKAVARVDVRVSSSAADAPLGSRCTLEIQPRGCEPVAVAHEGLMFEHALAGATAKGVAALEQVVGKTPSSRRP